MAGPTGASSGSVVKKDIPPRAPSRAFQMSTEEAREKADVVSGTFSLTLYLHASYLIRVPTVILYQIHCANVSLCLPLPYLKL